LEHAVRPFIIDTSTVPLRDQYEWYTVQLDEVFGIKSEPVFQTPSAYHGVVDVLKLSPMTYLHFVAENNFGLRLTPQIRRVEWGQYCIYREMGDGILFDLAGQEVVTSKGDLVIYDGDTPMRSRAKTTFDHSIWMLPRPTLDAHLPRLPRPLVVHIPAAAGIVSLATAYLDALADPIVTLTEPQAAMVADNLARLIAMACGAAAKPHTVAVQTARLDQLKRLIEQHLTSPSLSPEVAAAGLGVSVRQVHLLFEPTGETFSSFVRRRRLQECRATLENPLTVGRSVADIALGWGFASLPTFYRSFQAAFGLAPGDVRDISLRAMR
jgi:AraC-like DNA-binding protein